TKTGGATSGGAGASGSATGGSAAGGSTGGSQGGTSSTSASSGGSTSTGACAPRVLSLSSNATGSAADTAYSHVEVDMGSDLPIGNAARTVEFWAYIKTTDWVGEKNELYYIGAATGAASASTFGLDFGTNAVAGTSNHATLNPFTNGLNDDTDVDLGINSSTDQWVHVAMTWDQKALVTYVNGVAKITDNATTAVPKLNTSQSILYIGCNPTNKNCFNGEFAEFRVWNVARSAADILANYKKPMLGNEAGLVGYWKFDDAATATTAADSVTTTGHTAHPGTLKATTAAQNPTFVAPSPAVPITCP
ncbi:MAG: LamG domain-containing protein, partial [Polyangia bacterium]